MHITSGRLLLPAVLTGLLTAAACGSSGGGGPAGGGTTAQAGGGTTAQAGGGTMAPAGGTSTTTVTVRATDKGKVLTDKSGRTLYVSDQEKGTVRCKTSACTAIWVPVTVAAGSRPTAPSGVSGTLSTIRRPDGTLQVALNGKPLYTFSFDHSAGSTAGDGQHDSFDGTNFTWHAATATGTVAPAPAPSKAPASSPVYNYPY